MEPLAAIYFVIGLIFGIERLSRVTKEDEQGMVCIGIMAIIMLWPLYLMYKVWKKRVIHNMKERCKRSS
jgi:hypothetical protein